VEAESNSVRAEYMVTEAVPGVLLKDIWDRMAGLQHIDCIQSLGKIVEEFYSLDFESFGSLYFNTPDGPADSIPLDEEYCIGPNCARQHWGYYQEKAVSSSVLTRCQGPCKSIYLEDALQCHAEPLEGMV
jgi:hypothetical protein